MPRTPSATPALDRRLAMLRRDGAVQPIGPVAPTGWVPAPPRPRPDRSAGKAGQRPAGARPAVTPRIDPRRMPSEPSRHTDSGRHRRPSAPVPGLVSVPIALREAMTRPGRRAVLGLLIVLVLAALVLGARVAMAREAATPRPATPASTTSGLVARSIPQAFAGAAGQASPASAAAPSALPSAGPSAVPSAAPSAAAAGTSAGTPAASGPTLASGAASPVVVDVVGQVHRPGVVHLPPGSRVLDAVAAAGGALRSAQTSAVNLAKPVIDGEQILIPKPGQSPTAPTVASSSVAAGSPTSGAAAILDLNSADATALDSLPGVGPVLAQRILDWRRQHGRFSTVDELGEVTGIGDKLLAQIGPRVRI